MVKNHKEGLFSKALFIGFKQVLVFKAKRLFRLSACKDAAFYITEQIKKDIIKHIFKIIETYLQLLLFFNN